MKLSFWSDEDRWFVPRTLGIGYSLNLKYVAKRLGWINAPKERAPEEPSRDEGARPEAPSREERLKERIEASKVEDER